MCHKHLVNLTKIIVCIYMHTEKSHFQALNHYLPCLDDEFIYLVDDWNWQRVKDGTNQAIKENKCEI